MLHGFLLRIRDFLLKRRQHGVVLALYFPIFSHEFNFKKSVERRVVVPGVYSGARLMWPLDDWASHLIGPDFPTLYQPLLNGSLNWVRA